MIKNIVCDECTLITPILYYTRKDRRKLCCDCAITAHHGYRGKVYEYRAESLERIAQGAKTRLVDKKVKKVVE